ncbi:MAG TPA: protein kinase [Myxococcaceae bacterium]|nr:protein kinase [Myxococcaceae bacterium]
MLAGRFVVLRFVARGGMGGVYEARDMVLQSTVALKVLEPRVAADPAAMTRFHREVLLARQVSHPNVCRVYEFFETTNSVGEPIHFLTMEFLEGQTLSRWLRRKGRLALNEAIPLVNQMCEGLSAAHEEGVVHRDFKSSNVILVPRSIDSADGVPRVVITDFGIARALKQGIEVPEPQLITGSGLLGTPAYMAPEQVTGGSISPATDIYSLGVVLYEIVTGQLPFSGDTALATAVRRVEEPPPTPEGAAPGLDSRWTKTILRCLDRDPARRFQHANEVAAALVAQPPRRRRLLLAALLGSLLLLVSGVAVRSLRGAEHGPPWAALPAPSVAVMPFVDLSPQHDQEYLSDGVAEEIIGVLTQTPGIRVVARSSSFSFKGRNEDLRSVGAKLRVAHILEGSVRKAGDRLRVTAQLVNADDGYQLWSRTFDRKLVDIFAVQDEVAREVARALKGSLLSSRKGRTIQTTSPEAYASYLNGLQLLNAGSFADVRKAVADFESSVALDPRYAPAHAALAKALLFYESFAPADEPRYPRWQSRVLAEAEAAASLDSELADAYAVRGDARLVLGWEWDGARSDLEHALELAPANAYALRRYALLLEGLGRRDQALDTALQAVDLDPVSGAPHFTLAGIQMRLGRYPQARGTLLDATRLAPRHPGTWLQWCTELLDGKPAAALSIALQSPTQFNRNFGAALAYHSLGDDSASRQALDRMIASEAENALYDIARTYAWRGEQDQALEWLERALVEHDPVALAIQTDPLLRSLREDPRFLALLERFHFPKQ